MLGEHGLCQAVLLTKVRNQPEFGGFDATAVRRMLLNYAASPGFSIASAPRGGPSHTPLARTLQSAYTAPLRENVASLWSNQFEGFSVYGATGLESRRATVLNPPRFFPRWREARSMLILKAGSMYANGPY